MNRRQLLQAGLGAGAAGLAAPRSFAQTAPARKADFRLGYAPHPGMFAHSAGEDIVAQLEFARDQGFTAWEDNNMAGRPVEEQERIGAALERLGMRMGVFVANFGTAFGKKSFSNPSDEDRASFLADLKTSVEVAKRVNAKWMTVVAGDLEPRMERAQQDANAIEMLRRGAGVFEPHGLVMVLEALNPWRDHPGMLLWQVSQGYLWCKAVASPAVKILYDLYHQQISEGNLIPNMDAYWDEIAYVQTGDHPGRNEPGTGEVNYRNVFGHLHAKGYRGVLGMEHGNSRPGADGERAVIEAYRAADSY
jgi:hydroxypyruvate isomerase